MKDLYLSWSDSAKPDGSESSGSSHWVKRRTRSRSVLPLLLVMDHLRGTTQGLHRYSNFFFGNFIVRQSAFWVCCYRCSQLMFWHCSWQAWFSRALLGEKPWKTWHCFIHFSFLCVILYKNGGETIVPLKSMDPRNGEKEWPQSIKSCRAQAFPWERAVRCMSFSKSMKLFSWLLILGRRLTKFNSYQNSDGQRKHEYFILSYTDLSFQPCHYPHTTPHLHPLPTPCLLLCE